MKEIFSLPFRRLERPVSFAILINDDMALFGERDSGRVITYSIASGTFTPLTTSIQKPILQEALSVANASSQNLEGNIRMAPTSMVRPPLGCFVYGSNSGSSLSLFLLLYHHIGDQGYYEISHYRVVEDEMNSSIDPNESNHFQPIERTKLHLGSNCGQANNPTDNILQIFASSDPSIPILMLVLDNSHVVFVNRHNLDSHEEVSFANPQGTARIIDTDIFSQSGNKVQAVLSFATRIVVSDISDIVSSLLKGTDSIPSDMNEIDALYQKKLRPSPATHVLSKVGKYPMAMIKQNPSTKSFFGLDKSHRLQVLQSYIQSDFPGPQYPVGFKLIQKIITYHEAEDELDRIPPTLRPKSSNEEVSSELVPISSISHLSQSENKQFYTIPINTTSCIHTKELFKYSLISDDPSDGNAGGDPSRKRIYTIDEFLPIPKRVKNNELMKSYLASLKVIWLLYNRSIKLQQQ